MDCRVSLLNKFTTENTESTEKIKEENSVFSPGTRGRCVHSVVKKYQIHSLSPSQN